MLYFYIILAAFLVNKVGTYLTIQIAKKQHLVESNDYRKIHTEQVAALGGLPIFITLLMGSIIVMPSNAKVIAVLFAACILVGIGLWDDLKSIGIKPRIFVQLIVANIAYFTGFNLGLTESSAHLFLDYMVTIGFIGLMINGTNFIDGINGLAGSLGVLATAFFASIFYAYGYTNLALFSMLYLGTLLGFLSYNFGEKASIFMGDNGSTVMGFLLAIFALKVWNFSSALPNGDKLSILTLGLTALPILDIFGVVISRIIKGQSPFQADRNHIHHLVTDAGNTHPKACVIILGGLSSLMALFYFEIITNLFVATAMITISYSVFRICFSAARSPVISPVKWGKPVRQPSPIA